MEGGRTGLFCFAMQSPACRAAENSQGRPLRSAGRAAGVLRSHQFHRGLRGCSGPGGGALQCAGSRAVPAFEQTLSVARTAGKNRMLAPPLATVVSGLPDLPAPLALAFDATEPVTSPMHCPLSPFVSRASTCAGFLPAAARRRGQDGLVRFTSCQNGGCNVRRPRLPISATERDTSDHSRQAPVSRAIR